jgi:hypothetical protein
MQKIVIFHLRGFKRLFPENVFFYSKSACFLTVFDVKLIISVFVLKEKFKEVLV